MKIHSGNIDSFSKIYENEKLMEKTENLLFYFSSEFRNDQVTKSPPIRKKVSTATVKLLWINEIGFSGKLKTSSLLIAGIMNLSSNLWPKMIQNTDRDLIPFRQWIAFGFLLLVMSKSAFPFVYIENATKSSSGSSVEWKTQNTLKSF